MCISDIHVHCSVDETFRTVQALQFVNTSKKGERNKKKIILFRQKIMVSFLENEHRLK
ncbi:hypothetical protein D917_08089 [Trichinella nativa]|uniref:Uncharacterized protein n=1 Tax=Trichinella nativa TaxID=6335 RepID=A0A1Y3EQF9_9BILA|nr:hypothetical protein D917_08089 [Trichinella nativa]